jgi:DNA modification methylase
MRIALDKYEVKREVPLNEILTGHALELLRGLPSDSVHCVVTSPPYYGLRLYGTPPVIWGGSDKCEHQWTATWAPGGNGDGKSARRDKKAQRPRGAGAGDLCTKCDAWRGHLGLEPVHDCGCWAMSTEPCTVCYVCHVRMIFAEVRRVLRPDGTLWLNLGDSYSTGSTGVHKTANSHGTHAKRIRAMGEHQQPNRGGKLHGLKPKDLIGMPWRIAFALQADGWYLRRDIIWEKPNPMPESVSDRPTAAHEYLFLMSKSELYFCDMAAIRVPMSQTSINRLLQTNVKNQTGGQKEGLIGRHRSSRRALLNLHDKLVRARDWEEKDDYWNVGDPAAGRNRRDVWSVPIEPFSMEFCTACKRPYDGAEFGQLANLKEGDVVYKVCVCGRHDSWLSHFATFPQGLVEPCILAGTSERGACAKCGTPWKRVTEKPQPSRASEDIPRSDRDGGLTNQPGFDRIGMTHRQYDDWLKENPAKTVGWVPNCNCPNGSVPNSVVLDPFMGSGTTALVALRAGRRFVGLELNPDYVALALGRIKREAVQKRMF